MTSSTDLHVGVIGTGLIGTSVALAATRIGCSVRGWDLDPERAGARPAVGGLAVGPDPRGGGGRRRHGA